MFEHQRPRPWASLEIPDYRLLWGSVLFSNFANQSRQFVSIWLVFELTGSPLQLGLMGLFQALPLLAIGLFAGAVVDGKDRRTVLILTQISNLLLTLILGALAIGGMIQTWHIYVITMLGSSANAFSFPARTAMISNLVPGNYLMNGLALLSAGQQAVMIISPLIAGLIVGSLGAGLGYLIHLGFFFPAILLLGLMRRGSGSSQSRQRVSLASLVDGVRFVWVTKILLAIIILDTTVMVFGFYRPLLPIFAKEIFEVGPVGLGALMAAPEVGAALATVLLLVLGNVERKGLIVLYVTGLYAFATILFGISPVLLLALLLGGVLGFADSLGLTPRTTMVQVLSPDHMRGRANSIFSLSAGVANNLGFLVMGTIAEFIGPRLAMIVGGSIGLVSVLLCSVGWKSLRQFRG